MAQIPLPEASRKALAQMNHLGAAGEPFLFVIDYEMQRPLILPVASIDADEVVYWINGVTNRDVKTEEPPSVSLKKEPLPVGDYIEAFEQVMEELRYGNSFLLNLTFSTRVHLNLSLEEIFDFSRAPYRLLLRDHFVVFSPECFVRIADGRISTFPMKGTIDASLPDARLRILESPKEMAEHITIVDLLRNDLSRIARNVRVDRFRFLEEVRTHEKTLLQVSSEISGELPEDYPSRIGDLLFELLPAGSISGAPKPKTVEILQCAEKVPRGYFTGVFGYFDGNKLDSGVMIRFIEKSGDERFFRSGGGITTQSLAEEEYQEMIDKVYVPVY